MGHGAGATPPRICDRRWRGADAEAVASGPGEWRRGHGQGTARAVVVEQPAALIAPEGLRRPARAVAVAALAPPPPEADEC